MNNKRTLLILLICSFAINLLLAGGVAGHFLSRQGLQGPFSQPHLPRLIRSLDSETREKLKPLVRQHSRALMPQRRDLHRAQQEFNEAILSEPFDETSVKQAVSRLQVASESFQTQMHEQMIAVMKRLTPEQRQRALRGSHQRQMRNHEARHRQRSHDREP